MPPFSSFEIAWRSPWEHAAPSFENAFSSVATTRANHDHFRARNDLLRGGGMRGDRRGGEGAVVDADLVDVAAEAEAGLDGAVAAGGLVADGGADGGGSDRAG